MQLLNRGRGGSIHLLHSAFPVYLRKINLLKTMSVVRVQLTGRAVLGPVGMAGAELSLLLPRLCLVTLLPPLWLFSSSPLPDSDSFGANPAAIVRHNAQLPKTRSLKGKSELYSKPSSC